MLEVTAAAKRLMVSKYSDLFPGDYVEDWERRRLFEVATNVVAVSGEAEVEGLRRLLQLSAAVAGVSPGSSSAGVRHGTTALWARRETGAPGSRAGDQPTLIRPNGSHGDA
jgi:hypothetical protein